MDADSGRVLYSENKDQKKLIASTTKIMTAIIAIENAPLNMRIKVGKEIYNAYGSMTYIKEGEEFTLEDLLKGMMLQSGNDAALTIATHVMPYNNFIVNMNLKAYKLGMYNTTFENPHGLNDETKNYSTAYDMALLMRYAINNKDFINITSTYEHKAGNYIWYNKNKLLREYKYLISGKIGYTTKSGQVFVSAAKKNNKTLVIASIDERDKFNLHKRLYEKYFDNYERYKVLDKDMFSFKVKNDSHDHYYIKKNFYMLLNKNEINDLKIKINLNNNKNNVEIYLNNNLIHNEKLYVLKYESRINKIKKMLSFWK
jgi:D-alanyl-D-alanine carboxypeptidase